MAKKPQKTRADLLREIAELEAQILSTHARADKDIQKSSTDHLMASGVMLRLTALGGREIIPPVLIRDGLSAESIAALRADIRRSYKLGTLMKPEGL